MAMRTKEIIARMRERWESIKRTGYLLIQVSRPEYCSSSCWKEGVHSIPSLVLEAPARQEWATVKTNQKGQYTGHELEDVSPYLIDAKLGRRMRKKGLDTEEKKTPMYIEDLVPLQETVLRTIEKRFYIGLQRMQQNTFLILEIIYDPSLMLSPYTFLLGMLFYDDALRRIGTDI
ncbi:uncharacterized protein N7458_004063 [Penicillium daleae]|uniref:Uncharacterized protein n=1 Tax=Penicillium daleae TaxID=63821 RepID=A0AAD6G487_9EURO|nr:uncharacterized protein N7458_004063 [Penicillium daleae]KAJ5455799.1 hypothetical protein N7458_004063 [Penicillium daleae]